jgi:hypothetical protein
MQFSIGTSNWRKPYLIGPSSSKVSKRHGIQRDRVADWKKAHKKRFASELAKRIDRWSSREQVNPVVLVGEHKKNVTRRRETGMPIYALWTKPRVTLHNTKIPITRER